MLSGTKLIERSLFGMIILLTGSIIVLSWVPPVSRDALTHHLFVPKLYIKHGGIYEIPNIPFSYYPMNLDLLYLIPLYFSNDIIPKLIHFIFALLTAWLIFGYIKKRIDSKYGLFGALFFLSIPIIVKLSITVYVDLGLIFFTTASLLLILKWLETAKIKWLVVSAVMCGLALGTKYNGLITLFLLTLFIPPAYLRYPGKGPKNQLRAVGYSLSFLLISLLIFSPWMIRNYVWTKNPVYPLYNRLWNPPAEKPASLSDDDKKVESIHGLKPFALRKIVYGENWWQLVTIPVRIFFEGKDDDPKFFDGKLNPFLLFLPLTLFIGFGTFNRRLRFETKFLALFSSLFLFLVMFQSDMRIRYASPMVSPLVILSVIGLKYIGGLFNRPSFSGFTGSAVSFLLCALILAPNAFYIQSQFAYVNPLPFILGKVSRTAYIERYRPEYRLIRFANSNLPEKSKILFLFIGNRGYYSDREIFFGYDWLKQEIQKVDAGRGLAVSMKDQGITHLFMRSDLFLNWLNQELQPKFAKSIVNFMNEHTKLLFSHGGYRLYEILY